MYVTVADLDNVWHETARLQAEHFESGKRYHRYKDIDYVFPLAGGSFNARLDHTQSDTPDASPFADIESQLHAFFTAHHIAPEELRDRYGEKVDESESIATTQQASNKRGRADDTQQSDSSEQQRTSKRVSPRTAASVRPDSRNAVPQRDRNKRRPSAKQNGRSEEKAQHNSDNFSDEQGRNSRRLSKRIAAAVECKKEAAERLRQQQLERPESHNVNSSPDPSPIAGVERRDLQHYFFGYSCDQVFLQEAVWPTVMQSCATTVIQLDHIRPEMRQRNRQEEAAVAEWDADVENAQCSKAEHTRRQTIRCRARERSRWHSQKRKRMFKHYFGMVDERLFPQHDTIRDWLSRRVREVWSNWRQHSSSSSGSSTRRVSSWQPRSDAPSPTVDIHSLVSSPGHFSFVSAAIAAQYAHFAPSIGASYIAPPSATSPIDALDRWVAAAEIERRKQVRPIRQKKQQWHLRTSPSRQLSFSSVDEQAQRNLSPLQQAPPPTPSPLLPTALLDSATQLSCSRRSSAFSQECDAINVSSMDSSEDDESDILCSIVRVYG